ncbi:MAG: 30S ribosomal protein S4 [Firmicutes bacterium]|nr:30S ribosomal protein S4 [Bacillota bacterium]
MARYSASVCRLCRREAQKLYLKSERCFTPKCPVERRNYAPGEHGQSKRKMSEYGVQLREKQKARRIYGVLEAQFRRYFRQAAKRKGVTGETLLQLLERRLDNVVYRLSLAGSRPEARQLVRHGHFQVNGRKVNIPSYLVKENDTIAVAPGSRELPKMKGLVEAAKSRAVPEWLELDADNMRAKVARLPRRDEIDVPVQEHLIVELYSK